jgi:hypothetical protein
MALPESMGGRLITFSQFLLEAPTTSQTFNHCTGETIVQREILGLQQTTVQLLRKTDTRDEGRITLTLEKAIESLAFTINIVIIHRQ